MVKGQYDYSKLKGRAREKGLTLKKIQEKTGINASILSQKWNGKRRFTQDEMSVLKDALDLESIDAYFFTVKL